MKRNKSFDKNNFPLYLIATPIGNLKEFSSRAIEVVNEADIVAAEDTRNAYDLLMKFGIKKETYSLREHNEKEASKHLISLIQTGKKVVYMSDAGYPGISDPGYILVKEAIANDIAVSTVSGSSAFINALVASGLETKHFFFYGFLSAKDGEAKEEINNLKAIKNTLIFYEAPHRIIRTLKLLKDGLGNREVCLARELTKLNEEYIRGTLEELSNIEEETLKGEMVVIVDGNHEEASVSDDEITARVAYFTNLGLSQKDAVNVVSEEYKVNKNYIKKLLF